MKNIKLPPILPSGTLDDWENGLKPKISTFFENEVYGKAPEQYECKFTIADDDTIFMNGSAVRRIVNATIKGRSGSFSFPFVIFRPADRKKCPVFLFLCNRDKSEHFDADRRQKSDFWPAERIVERGFCACGFHITDVVKDLDDGYKTGIQKIFGTKTENSWGSIAAWAFAASRIIDYLITMPEIDGQKIAVAGHSRCGKAALWCGALDTRVYLTVSNNSGCTGAAPSCVKDGETIEQINTAFPHWFCENYKKYNHVHPPYDQHMLLACMAPRKLYVASSSEDDWADPQAEFYSAVSAGRIYQLYGKSGLQENRFPDVNCPIQKGQVGYHVRAGKHNLTFYDWERFMDFMD